MNNRNEKVAKLKGSQAHTLETNWFDRTTTNDDMWSSIYEKIKGVN